MNIITKLGTTELLKQFPEYINIQPSIFYTYRDTTLGYVMSK